MEDFAGRVAFVTGGASGLGFSMAKSLAAAGASIAIADIDPEATENAAASLRAEGWAALAVALDVRDREAWARGKAEVEREFGPVTILLNNAGVTGYDRIVETPPAYWDWVIGVNLTGVFNGIHTFGTAMIEHGRGGHIVNTASTAGIHGSDVISIGAYIASKAGVVGLSERLRIELAEHAIGVSILVPGMFSTNIGSNVAKLRPVPGSVELADNPDYMVLRARSSRAMNPEKVGPFVLDAMRENRAYIFTHLETRDMIQKRADAMLADFRGMADPSIAPDLSWYTSSSNG